jgi:hypothetical protein
MIKETKVASFRLDSPSVEWIRTQALKRNISQADLVRNLIQQSESIVLAKEGIDTSISFAKNQSAEKNNLLLSLGVGTASGLTGYYLAGWIRKQFKMEEDKGTQILIGLMLGLGSLLFTGYKSSKK